MNLLKNYHQVKLMSCTWTNLVRNLNKFVLITNQLSVPLA